MVLTDLSRIAQFNELVSQGQYKPAAVLVSKSPNGCLRNMDTIRRFQQLPQVQGQASPILIYFSTLLENTKLNAEESVELARPVLQQGKKDLYAKWLEQDKVRLSPLFSSLLFSFLLFCSISLVSISLGTQQYLKILPHSFSSSPLSLQVECSEMLGDMIAASDVKMALSVYIRANATEKVINCFIQLEQYADIVGYCNKVGYQPDYTFMLQNMVRRNPSAAAEFAKLLAGTYLFFPLLSFPLSLSFFP